MQIKAEIKWHIYKSRNAQSFQRTLGIPWQDGNMEQILPHSSQQELLLSKYYNCSRQDFETTVFVEPPGFYHL